MNRLARFLMVASIALLLTGIGLAVAQPGGLGDDDETAAGPTTTEVDGDGTTSEPSDTSAPDTTSTSDTSATTDTSGTTGTTAPGATTTTPGDGGSGIGSDGAADPGDTADGLASTGGESLLLLSLAVAGAGLALRRSSLRST